MVDRLKNALQFLGKTVRVGCAEVSTVFINPDIYWDRMFLGEPTV